MKIAHFTDLHINSVIRESNISETIALFENALKHGADHICITGDLSHDAEPEDFEALRYLLDYFSLINGEKISVVVGNHDIFGGPQKAEDIFTFPQRCRETDYDGKLEIFTSYFEETFENCIYKPAGKFYPYAKIIDDCLIIGLNSIDKYSSVKNPFASNGYVDQEQLAELESILNGFGKEVRHRIVLVHHHFNKIKNPSSNMMHYFWQVVEKQTMKLKKKKELLQMFKEHNVSAVLHGHIHSNLEYNRKGVHFINSGGWINNAKEGELSYYMVDCRKKSIKTELITMPFSSKKKKYLLQNERAYEIS